MLEKTFTDIQVRTNEEQNKLCFNDKSMQMQVITISL